MSGGAISHKWEYFVAQYTGSVWNSQGEWSQPDVDGFSTEQMLNHFGEQGWELVTIGPVHSNSGAPSAAYIFKRQVI